MNRIAAIILSVIVSSMSFAEPARAATGHEANCSVTNINWTPPGVINLVCASGNVYLAFISGYSNAGTCQTTDMDTLKVYESLGITARASQLSVTVWYDTACGRANGMITSLELTGN